MITVGRSSITILWAAPDHAALVSAAVDVAAADGLTYLGRLLTQPAGLKGGTLLSRLAQGAVDADYPVSGGYVLHLYHFHQPWTHRGYAGSEYSAANVASNLFGDALRLWRAGRRPEAAYELGRAAHVMTDCWIPQHAAGVAGCGHGPYEAWLTDSGRWRDYAPGGGGRYEWQAAYYPAEVGPPHVLDWRNPYDWVDLAAHESYTCYQDGLNGCVNPGYREDFPAAARLLVPGAIRHLAGFLHYFFTLAGAAPAGSPGREAGATGEGTP